jgi:purine-binding chemotaxis protein CheW
MKRDVEEGRVLVDEHDRAHSDGDRLTEVPLLTFRLAGQMYGIAIECVVQIIEMVTITHLPHAPAAVRGVINFQGQIVPVLDLRSRFSLPFRPYGLYTPIILVYMAEQIAGLIVDGVHDVHAISAADLVKPDHFHLADLIDLLDDDIDLSEAEEKPPLPTAFLWAIAKTKASMILVLDVKAILTHHEEKSLLRALAESEAVNDSSRKIRESS